MARDHDRRIGAPAGRGNHFSILVRFTLNESVDTDPAHQRYELIEKAGSFWFNVREDTSPRYRLRVGGFLNGHSTDTFTGTRVIPSTTPIWAIATYDGAHLRTYVARGDGTHLALDRSVAQTGTLNTGATITGVDEKLVVGAKHRKGHAPGGSGTNEDAEAFFNGTMSRFLVYGRALTRSEIASAISGFRPWPVGDRRGLGSRLGQGLRRLPARVGERRVHTLKIVSRPHASRARSTTPDS